MKIGMKTEHFRQSLSSQNLRNDVSEHQDFKILWGSMFLIPLVARAFGVCVIYQCRLKKLPILHTQKGSGHPEKENRVIDTWHKLQYYLPRAITVICKRNIYIICNQFIVVKHVQCRMPTLLLPRDVLPL